MKRAVGELWERAGTGSGHVIEDEGAPVTQRGTINFTGAGVSVADAGGKTVVTISGGAAWDFDEGDQSVAYAVGTIDLEEGGP